MAPAIVHFLVGAALLVALATPLFLRYGFDREHAIWLIPLGGIWGLFPDLHHITPIYSVELYALHGTPWTDLFAFHYALDRPAVRARYHGSVFGSIALFTASVAAFWGSARASEAAGTVRSRSGRALASAVSTIGAAAYATVALGVVVGVRDAFPTVAAIAGSDRVLVGSVLLVALGVGLGVLYALGFETLALEATDPSIAAGLGCAFGVGSWVGGVALVIPYWLRFVTASPPPAPLFHWGSLGALLVHGAVFGGAYALLEGTHAPEPGTSTAP